MEKSSLILAVPLVLVAALCAGPAAAASPVAWQRVVITEVLPAPAKVEPGTGQWIELQNQGSATVNLQGMVLSTKSGQFHVISAAQDLNLAPGAFLVLGRSDNAGVNGGAAVGYMYGGDLLLDPAADILMIQQNSELVDVATWGPEAVAVLPGASLSLEPRLTAGAVKSWCSARVPYGELGILGTPGYENTWCDIDHDGYAEDQGDCDDGDALAWPGAKETCNGADNDCDGLVDSDLERPTLRCLDGGECRDVPGVCAGVEGWKCPDAAAEPIETTCDGFDNDCDGETDEVEVPSVECLQLGVCAGSSFGCAGAAGFRCSYPDTFREDEQLCDGLDNDCDGDTDEGFGAGTPCWSGLGSCARLGELVCSTDGASSACSAAPGSPAEETCGNDRDDDCDGDTDEGYPVSELCVVGTGACATIGKYRCGTDGRSVVCQARPDEPSDELCGDRIDNDCDGDTDEDDCRPAHASSPGCGASPVPSTPGSAGLLALLMGLVTRSARRRAEGSRPGWRPPAP